MTLEVDEVDMQGRLHTAKPVKPSFSMMESLAKEKHSLIHHYVANTLHRDPNDCLEKDKVFLAFNFPFWAAEEGNCD